MFLYTVYIHCPCPEITHTLKKPKNFSDWPYLVPVLLVTQWSQHQLWVIRHQPEAWEHAAIPIRPVPSQARCVLWYCFISSANPEQVVSDLYMCLFCLGWTERSVKENVRDRGWLEVFLNSLSNVLYLTFVLFWYVHIFSYIKYLHIAHCKVTLIQSSCKNKIWEFKGSSSTWEVWCADVLFFYSMEILTGYSSLLLFIYFLPFCHFMFNAAGLHVRN